MKNSTRRLLVLAALVGATLCSAPGLPKADLKAAGPAPQTARQTVRLNGEAPASVDVDSRDGKVVGMTAVMKDGSRIVLTPQSKPTCATACPKGQKQICWKDEKQMTICVCTSGGGGGGIGTGAIVAIIAGGG